MPPTFAYTSGGETLEEDSHVENPGQTNFDGENTGEGSGSHPTTAVHSRNHSMEHVRVFLSFPVLPSEIEGLTKRLPLLHNRPTASERSSSSSSRRTTLKVRPFPLVCDSRGSRVY